MEGNSIVIRDSKTFWFNFDWPKNKFKFWLIIKSNESLAENKIKNEIQQLSLKYNHGNNIHEHKKQQRLKLKSSNKHVTLQNLSIYTHGKI